MRTIEDMTTEMVRTESEPVVADIGSKTVRMVGVTYAGEAQIPVDVPPAEFTPFPTLP